MTMTAHDRAALGYGLGANEGEGFGTSRRFARAPAAGDQQRVERALGEGFGDKLHPRRTRHRAGFAGYDPDPVRRLAQAARRLEHRDRPGRVEQLELREDQNADRPGHGMNRGKKVISARGYAGLG